MFKLFLQETLLLDFESSVYVFINFAEYMVFHSAVLLRPEIFLALVYQCVNKATQSILMKFRHLFLISSTGCSGFFSFLEFLLVMTGYT